jgi:hypothetical protein
VPRRYRLPIALDRLPFADNHALAPERPRVFGEASDGCIVGRGDHHLTPEVTHAAYLALIATSEVERVTRECNFIANEMRKENVVKRLLRQQSERGRLECARKTLDPRPL